MKRSATDVECSIALKNSKGSVDVSQIVQNFPPELWDEILAHTTLPITTLLSLKTVCKSWSHSVMLTSTLHVPENIFWKRGSMPSFQNLKSLFIDSLFFKASFFDISSMTQLKKLVLFCWSHLSLTFPGCLREVDGSGDWTFDCEALTQLEVLSTNLNFGLGSLGQLTNLRKLTNLCFSKDSNTQHLTQLTTLETLYVTNSTSLGGFGAHNFQGLPSLKRLIFRDKDFFGHEKCKGIFVEQEPDGSSCIRLFDGEWSHSKLHGKASLWYPYWKRDDPNGESPYFQESLWYKTDRIRSSTPLGPRVRTVRYGTHYAQEQELKAKNWICYFDGHFEEDIIHGTGTYFWPNGTKWTGTWEWGTSVSEGVLELPSGIVKKGTWQQLLGDPEVLIEPANWSGQWKREPRNQFSFY